MFLQVLNSAFFLLSVSTSVAGGDPWRKLLAIKKDQPKVKYLPYDWSLKSNEYPYFIARALNKAPMVYCELVIPVFFTKQTS